MPYIQIDVDLDEFDTDELLEEIENRIKRKRSSCETDRVKDICNSILRNLNSNKPTLPVGSSLHNEILVEVIYEAAKKYTPWQIQELLA